jgi:hypothetical protein
VDNGDDSTTLNANLHPDIFERLKSHGIDASQYFHIKRILASDLPQSILFFQRDFGPHTPAQVLRQVDRWRHLLRRDCIVRDEQRSDLEATIDRAELFAWRSVIASIFPKLGEWNLSTQRIPRTEVEDGRPVFMPDIQITANNETTGERRDAGVAGCDRLGPAWCQEWRKALEELGLFKLAMSQSSGQPRLVSSRSLQAWPIFTQNAIPRLYEFLLPYYQTKGHVWSEHESNLKRDAYYPKDLLRDMLNILQIEEIGVYGSMKANQLKSVIQRHLGRLGTTSPKKPKITK